MLLLFCLFACFFVWGPYSVPFGNQRWVVKYLSPDIKIYKQNTMCIRYVNNIPHSEGKSMCAWGPVMIHSALFV